MTRYAMVYHAGSYRRLDEVARYMQAVFTPTFKEKLEHTGEYLREGVYRCHYCNRGHTRRLGSCDGCGAPL